MFTTPAQQRQQEELSHPSPAGQEHREQPSSLLPAQGHGHVLCNRIPHGTQKVRWCLRVPSVPPESCTESAEGVSTAAWPRACGSGKAEQLLPQLTRPSSLQPGTHGAAPPESRPEPSRTDPTIPLGADSPQPAHTVPLPGCRKTDLLGANQLPKMLLHPRAWVRGQELKIIIKRVSACLNPSLLPRKHRNSRDA